MVVSEKLYSPQNYLELVTGECYSYNGDSDIGFIDSVLKENGLEELWDYPLSEIDEIVENGLNVVLVDCMEMEDGEEPAHVLRWYEVPEKVLEKLK